MPRAHRHYRPGHVWHLTHRCHQRDFLLKFCRDRDNDLQELYYQARKRFGLCGLGCMVTSNHVHLLGQGRRGRRDRACGPTRGRADGSGVQPQKGTPGRLL